MHYQELETEKFLRQQVDRQYKDWRRARSRKAVRDFVTFVVGLVAIGVVLQVVTQLAQ